MIKKIALMSIIASTVMFSGCGGGGGSKNNPTPTATPTATPTSGIAAEYKKLTDLEYKTLNMTTKLRNNKTFKETIKFHDDYTQDGKYLLDYRSTKDAVILCGEVENQDVFSYFCLYGSSKNKSMVSYALNIDHNGKIRGNSKYSETGDTDELIEVYDGNKADGSITGTVTVTEGKNKPLMKIENSSFENLKGAKVNVTLMNDSKVSANIHAMLNEMKTIIAK